MSEQKRLSVKILAIILTSLLILSLLPIIGISFYNSPYYDDYGYTLTTHEAWVSTHSLWSTIKAAVKNVLSTRNTWEANYSNTFLHSFQPTVFGESYYWISTFLILASLLGGIACFLQLLIIRILDGSREAFWCCFSGLSLIAIQFVPCARETFFWHSGGMAYTFLWAIMMIRFCCLILLANKATPKAIIGFTALLLLLTFIVGGAKFSTSLLAIALDTCVVVVAFVRRSKSRWISLVLEILLIVCFITCITGQGNEVRAKTMADAINPVIAVAESFYFGIGLIGSWCNIRTFFVLLLLLCTLAPFLSKTNFSFRLPALFTLGAICLFCAQLAPTVYTGLYIGDGRVVNSYYFTFLLFLSAVFVYWLGWILRRFPNALQWTAFLGSREGITRLTASLLAILLIIGTISWKPDDAQSYGPQNTVSGSAARSLISGEAKAFHQKNTERMELLKNPEITEVELSLIPGSPYVFMGDNLDIENQEYVLNLFQTYFQKQAVTLKKEE